MISKQFIKSSFIYSIVGSLPLASGMVLLLFYANLLSKELVGILALYIAFTFLVQVLVNFALDTHACFFYAENRENKELVRTYIGTIFSALLILGLTYTVLSMFFGNMLFDLVLHDNFYPYGLMSVVTAIFNSYFRTYTSLLVYQQRPVKFLWYNLTNFFLTIAISVIGLYLYPNSLTGPMWGRLLSGIGIFILALTGILKEFGITFKVSYLKGMFLFCYPLLIYNILNWVLGNIDRFIINDYLTKADIAIYDIALKSTLIIEYFQMGLQSSFYPKIFKIWGDQESKESTPEINRYFNGFTAITLLILPVFVIIVPLIIPLIITKNDYSAAFPFLSLLSLGFITRGLFAMYSAPFYFLKKTKLLPKVFLFSAVCQVILSIVLIKYFGLWGAAWACFLVKPIQILFLYLESRKIFTFKFNKTKQIYLPLVFVCMVIASEILLKDQNRFVVYLFIFLTTFILTSVVYKNELKASLEQYSKIKYLNFLSIFLKFYSKTNIEKEQ